MNIEMQFYEAANVIIKDNAARQLDSDELFNLIDKEFEAVIDRWRALRTTCTYVSDMTFETYLRSILSNLPSNGEEKRPRINNCTDVYRVAADLVNAERLRCSDFGIEIETADLRNTFAGWYNTTSFNRKDSYERLLELVFALRLSSDMAFDFIDSLGAKQPYALDPRELSIIAAMEFNDYARINNLPTIPYFVAKHFGQTMPEIINTAIYERAQDLRAEHSDLSEDQLELYAMLLYYFESREAAIDAVGHNDNITRLTQYVSDQVVDFDAYRDETIQEDEKQRAFRIYKQATKNLVKANIGAFFRARKHMTSLMLKFIFGSTDLEEFDLSECYWLENSERTAIQTDGTIDHTVLSTYFRNHTEVTAIQATNPWTWLNIAIDRNVSSNILEVINSLESTIAGELPRAREQIIRERVTNRANIGNFNAVFIEHHSLIFDTHDSSHRGISREALFRFLLLTGRISRNEDVNPLLCAAGESALSGTKRSDYAMIAIMIMQEWLNTRFPNYKPKEKRERFYHYYIRKSLVARKIFS